MYLGYCMMSFFWTFEIDLVILIGVYHRLSLCKIFASFILKSFGFFVVHIRWPFISSIFERHCIIIPEIDNPVQVVLGDKPIFHEMLKFSDIAGHKISLFDYNNFFFFLHLYNKEYLIMTKWLICYLL